MTAAADPEADVVVVAVVVGGEPEMEEVMAIPEGVIMLAPPEEGIAYGTGMPMEIRFEEGLQPLLLYWQTKAPLLLQDAICWKEFAFAVDEGKIRDTESQGVPGVPYTLCRMLGMQDLSKSYQCSCRD